MKGKVTQGNIQRNNFQLFEVFSYCVIEALPQIRRELRRTKIADEKGRRKHSQVGHGGTVPNHTSYFLFLASPDAIEVMLETD